MKTSHNKHHRMGRHCTLTFHSRFDYSGGADGTWTVYRPNGAIMAANVSNEEFKRNRQHYDELWKEEIDAIEGSNNQQAN